MSLNSGHFGSSHHLDRVRFEVCFPTHPSLDDIWVREVENAEPNGCKPNGCKPMPMEVCGGYKTHQDDLPGSTTIEKDLPVGGWWKSSMSVGEMIQFDGCIFFKWVETTNQVGLDCLFTLNQ